MHGPDLGGVCRASRGPRITSWSVDCGGFLRLLVPLGGGGPGVELHPNRSAEPRCHGSPAGDLAKLQH